MARRSSGGEQVTVDGYREVLTALRKFAPEARKEFAKEMRGAAQPVLADARRNFAWSTRIPKALSLSVTQKGVGIRISRKKAPHGSIYERGTKGNPGLVRHPLFGNRDQWYSTPIRPGIKPALDQNRKRIVVATDTALRRAAKKAGL